VLEGRRTETRTFTFFRDDEAAVLLAVGDGLDYHHRRDPFQPTLAASPPAGRLGP